MSLHYMPLHLHSAKKNVQYYYDDFCFYSLRRLMHSNITMTDDYVSNVVTDQDE